MQLYRSDKEKCVAGVCGGVAESFGWSVDRVRGVLIIATLFTAFAGLLVYLALWYLMPKVQSQVEPALLQPWKKAH